MKNSIDLTFRRWHRRLGFLASVGVLIWSVSGAMHPLMSRYQPQPATRASPVLEPTDTTAPTLRAILVANDIASIVRARLVQWPAGAFWQIEPALDAPLRYFSRTDGNELAHGDALYAEFLARHYLGEPRAAMSELARLTRFEGDYPYVNRLLPAYRVAFASDPGRRVYVDTATSGLATIVDARKALFNDIFATLHLWRFFGEHAALRAGVAAILLGAALVTPVLGLAVYWRGRGRPAPSRARRWHRRLGLVIVVTLACSTASGAWHLLNGVRAAVARDRSAPRALAPIPVAELPATPPTPPDGALAELLVDRRDGSVDYRWRGAPPPVAAPVAHHGGAHATTHHAPASAEAAYARELALRFSGLPPAAIEDVRRVDAFDGEYGFINKRLPVYRVEFATPRADRYYVHLETATLAAHVDRPTYAEGWTFGNLHKWQFLDPLGKGLRDALQIGFAILNVAVALIGITVFGRAPRRGRTTAVPLQRAQELQ